MFTFLTNQSVAALPRRSMRLIFLLPPLLGHLTYAASTESALLAKADGSAEAVGLSPSDMIDWCLDELLRPRLPPLNGMDVLTRNYDLVGAHLGEALFNISGEQFKALLSNINQENLYALAKRSSIPGLPAITTLLTLDDGWTMQYILRAGSRFYLFPMAGKIIAMVGEKAALRAASFMINQGVDILVDPYRQLNYEHLVRFLRRLITSGTPIDIFMGIFKDFKDQIRSDAYHDLIAGACNIRDTRKFMEYFDLLWRIKPYEMSTVHQRVFEGQQSREKFWRIRRVKGLLEDHRTWKELEPNLTALRRELGGSFVPYFQQFDWFLGRSKLFYAAALSKDEAAINMISRLGVFLELGSSWKLLLESNAINLTWVLLNHLGHTLSRTQCILSGQYGTPAFLAVVLASDQCSDYTEEMHGRLGPPIFSDLTPDQSSRAANQKVAILSALPEMQRIADKVRGVPFCEDLGSASRVISVKLLHNSEGPLLTHEMDIIEVTAAVMMVALKIPTCHIKDLSLLPQLKNIAEWTTAALSEFCRDKKLKSTIILEQVKPPPRPRWLRLRLHM